MRLIETKLEGVCILQMDVFKDERGYFYETFSSRKFNDAYSNLTNKHEEIVFVQDNESCSQRNTLRGIHWQTGEHAQAKLVRCTRGRLLDVAVDLRVDSPTFLKYVAVELSEENKMQLFIPRGFGHAFLALEDNTILNYKCDNYYNKQSEASIYPLDFSIGIDWGLTCSDLVTMSDKDRNGSSSALIDKEKLFKIDK